MDLHAGVNTPGGRADCKMCFPNWGSRYLNLCEFTLTDGRTKMRLPEKKKRWENFDLKEKT